MPIYLKQSTASQEIPLGYFVDSTDGNTAETGLTIANTDIKLWKAGATTLADKNSGGATHIAGGLYYCVLDATDTGTLGSMIVFVKVAGALAVRVECVVLAANVYDSLIGGGDILDVSTTQFNGSAVTASSGRPEVNTTHAAGTAWGSGAITAASIASDAITAAKIADGAIDAGAFAADAITAAKLAADVTTELQSGLATSAALTTVSGKIDVIDDFLDTEIAAIKAKTDNLPAAPAATGDIPTAAAIADAVWDEATAGHTTAGSTGKALTDAGSAGDPWSTALPGAYGSGTAGKIVGDNINATISSRASQTSVDTVDDFLDTEIAAIKAKTDNLPAAPAATGDIPTAAAIADAVWDEATTGHVTAGTFGEQLKTDVDAILADTDVIGATGGGLTSLATQASVNTIDDLLDTEVAAIKTVVDAVKAKTDSLTFTVANVVDANIQRVNDVVVNGDGGSGTEWGP
jgi:hypothetical protein